MSRPRQLASELWRGRPLRFPPIHLETAHANPVAMSLASEGRAVVPDLTTSHIPISLDPLLIGLQTDEPLPRTEDVLHWQLTASPPETPRRIGFMRVIWEERLPLPALDGSSNAGLEVFRADDGLDQCTGRIRLWWSYLLARRHARRVGRQPGRLSMTPGSLRALDIYFRQPRPVYLVTTRHHSNVNIFPMDLVGEIPTGQFLFALRSTSPSIEHLSNARRAVFSLLPSTYHREIYRLGEHHKKSSIDCDALPFESGRSLELGWPIPAPALQVTELAIDDVLERGSHHLFISRRISRSPGNLGHVPVLGHISGLFLEWWSRQSSSPTPVSTGRDSA